MRSLGLPAGFRDVLFDEARARRHVDAKLAAVFEQLGYSEVLPSTIESFEVYLRGNQSVKDRVFRFLDREDNLLALRADFTPAVARIASTRLLSQELPIKVWYAGNVFRKVDPNQGRFCEIAQVGAELLGKNSPSCDAEIISTAMRCLESLGIDDVQLHVNHAGIFRGIVDAMELDRASLAQVKSELDRKDTRALEARLQALGVREEVQVQLHAIAHFIGGEEVLGKAHRTIRNKQSQIALGELQKLLLSLETWRKKIVIDLTEVDEMEYYSGVMFKFFSHKVREELGAGGRYDMLLHEFGRDMPAVGFSFSVDRLLELV